MKECECPWLASLGPRKRQDIGHAFFPRSVHTCLYACMLIYRSSPPFFFFLFVLSIAIRHVNWFFYTYVVGLSLTWKKSYVSLFFVPCSFSTHVLLPPPKTYQNKSCWFVRLCPVGAVSGCDLLTLGASAVGFSQS